MCVCPRTYTHIYKHTYTHSLQSSRHKNCSSAVIFCIGQAWMCGVSFKWHLQFYISVCALYTSHVGQARLYLQDTCALTMLFTPTGTMLNGSSHSPTSLNGAPSTPNGFKRDGLHPEHLAKRPCTISPSQRFSPSTGLPAHPAPNGLPTHPPNGLSHPPNPPAGPQHYRLEDMALAHHYRDAYRHNEHRDTRERHRQTAVHGARQEEVIDHRLTDREWAEEWKHLDNLLNCIMDMVEKTRRSLTVLRRCQEADREEMNHWIRRYSDVEEMKKGGSNGHTQTYY
uniref:CBFA2/RUNX1 partner transcriptional co-repressor 3 n=1 Tax=Myripristis murdjan TaxID=586833 RepID=A0A667X6K8_9TELE